MTRRARRRLLEQLPALLLAYRKDRGFTQGDVAKKLGVDLTLISKWECGTRRPGLSKLPSVAAMLDMTVDDLLSQRAA